MNDYKQTLVNDRGIKKYLKEGEVNILIPIVIEQIKSLNTVFMIIIFIFIVFYNHF